MEHQDGEEIVICFLILQKHGLAILSSVFKNETDIQINTGIVRAFVAIRQAIVSKPTNTVAKIQTELKEL